MIVGIQHCNLTVGSETWEADGLTNNPLELADKFYGEVLGLKQDPVPSNMIGKLRWFALGDQGQQIHISMERQTKLLNSRSETRGHPCFVVPFTKLGELKRTLNAFAESGHPGACSAVDEAGGQFIAPNSGDPIDGFRKGDRYFVRDFAGNRLELSGI